MPLGRSVPVWVFAPRPSRVGNPPVNPPAIPSMAGCLVVMPRPRPPLEPVGSCNVTRSSRAQSPQARFRSHCSPGRPSTLAAVAGNAVIPTVRPARPTILPGEHRRRAGTRLDDAARHRPLGPRALCASPVQARRLRLGAGCDDLSTPPLGRRPGRGLDVPALFFSP